MASFFLNREGNISVFKLGIGAAVLGGVMLVAAVILTAAEQAAYKAPLDLNEPPNTTFIVEEAISPVSSRLYFVTDDTPETVAFFYDQQLAEREDIDMSDPNRERCVRTPRTGTFPNYTEGNGVVPFEYKCLFQQISLQGIDRSTLVVIQPGVRNDETGMDNLNTTRIEYEQYWQP